MDEVEGVGVECPLAGVILDFATNGLAGVSSSLSGCCCGNLQFQVRRDPAGLDGGDVGPSDFRLRELIRKVTERPISPAHDKHD